MPQLKERLRGIGLPTSGKKADLIARLLESMATAEDPSTAAAAPPSPERHSGSRARLDLPGPAASAATVPIPEVLLDPSSAVAVAPGGTEGDPKQDADGVSEGWAAAAADALIAGDFSSSSLEIPSDGTGGSAGVQGVGHEAEQAARIRRLSGHATLVNLVLEALDNVRASQGGGVVSSRDLGRALAALPSPGVPRQSALILLKSKWPSLMAFLKACPSDFVVTDLGKRKEFGVVRNNAGGWDARGGGVEGMGGEERRNSAPVGATSVAAEQ